MNSEKWRTRALCANLPLAVSDQMFFGASPLQAERMCQRCPVTRQCKDFATEALIPFGVYGGERGADRRRRLGMPLYTATDHSVAA